MIAEDVLVVLEHTAVLPRAHEVVIRVTKLCAATNSGARPLTVVTSLCNCKRLVFNYQSTKETFRTEITSNFSSALTSCLPRVMAACTFCSVPSTSSYTSADHSAQFTCTQSSCPAYKSRPQSCEQTHSSHRLAGNSSVRDHLRFLEIRRKQRKTASCTK